MAPKDNVGSIQGDLPSMLTPLFFFNKVVPLQHTPRVAKKIQEFENMVIE